MGSYLAFWPFGPSFPFILAFWAFISFHFGLLGFHFLSFWPFRPLFPVILAFWACISFHFGLLGLVGLHFLAFWLCGLHFLAFWPFRGRRLGSFDFGLLGLVGLHFLAFWLCGLISLHFGLFGVGVWAPPQVAKNGPFAQRPSNGFISARTGSILQFLAFWAFISLHFGLVGLHFLAFWLCGPSFPCILALWAFISLHFGLVGLHFLAFWPFGGQLLGPPHKLPKMARLPNVLTMDLSGP